MKVIIENTEFPYKLGVRMLKAKYRTCQFPALEAKWDGKLLVDVIIPYSLRSI